MKRNIALVVVVLFVITSCSKKKDVVEEVVRDPRISELETLLESSPNDLESVDELLNLYFDSAEAELYIDLYEKYQEEFINSSNQRLNYASSLCMMADTTENVMKQLSWVKKGMVAFDNAVEDFPNEMLVYLYRGITYSNFPAVLGVRNVVERDFETIFTKSLDGEWELTEIGLTTIYYGYLNLAINYEDKELYQKSLKRVESDFSDQNSELFIAYKSSKKNFK